MNLRGRSSYLTRHRCDAMLGILTSDPWLCSCNAGLVDVPPDHSPRWISGAQIDLRLTGT